MPAHIYCMAYSFLIFDFGTDEDAAQQARHRIEGWQQGFRLGKKLQFKFERKELEAKQDAAPKPSPKTSKGGSKTKAKSAGKADTGPAASPAAASEIRVMVRLDFSGHEKLSHQRWVERIPAEELFKTAKSKVVRSGDPEFATTEEFFDALD